MRAARDDFARHGKAKRSVVQMGEALGYESIQDAAGPVIVNRPDFSGESGGVPRRFNSGHADHAPMAADNLRALEKEQG